MTRTFLFITGFIFSSAIGFSQNKAVASKNTAEQAPNIIVFMADDMGYADAGFTGSKDIRTPNLDELAASGVTFTHGYANHPFCGPSRAALLSGRYPYRFGFETNPAYDPANPLMGISPDEKLFPARLQEAGYVTGAVGKWHLGAAAPFHPNNRGFDYFYGFLGGGHDYFKIDLTKSVWEAYLQGLVRNDKPASFEGYLTTALSQDAAQFVENNKDHPFFLYVAYNAPHQPLQAPEEDIERYGFIKDKRRRVYAAMVDVMDRGIGEVVNALKENDIYENTLIFFLSDNGGPQPNPETGKGGNASSNLPFRGGKGNMYDGGVHVPFIACWPAKIKPGSTYDYPVNSLDIARTAVEVGRADATTGPNMEGVDLIPYVTGEKEGAPHEAIYWRSGNNNWAVLTADKTKLVDDRDSDQAELFYLPDDISEQSDIIARYSEKAKALDSKWKAWDSKNVPGQFLGYKKYHQKRDEFYEQAVANRQDAPTFKAAQDPKPTDKKWVKVEALSDEFEGNALDESKWKNTDPQGWMGRPPGIFKQDVVRVSDGKLNMTVYQLATPERKNDKTWTHAGAFVGSKKAAQVGYYFEAKMKGSKTFMSSTFWLINNKGDGNGCDARTTELDIQECVGHVTTDKSWAQHRYREMGSNTHSRNTTCPDTPTGTKGGQTDIGSPAYEDYHIYGAWWKSAEEILFFLDGQYLYTVKPEADFNLPMYLRMVSETYDWNPAPADGGMKGSAADRTTAYDWVRTWKLEDIGVDSTTGPKE